VGVWGEFVGTMGDDMEIENDGPVEVDPACKEHVMPWVEKYRPKCVDDIAHQEDVVGSLRSAIENGQLPHLLFYGPPGTGKTSTILAMARQMFGPYFKDRVLELNASDERGISIVREKVKNFASTSVSQVSYGGKKLPPFKLIILDEADSMTQDAQSALRRTMELYTRVTRFCLICNYVSRIIDPLASRCAKFRFQPLSRESFTKKIKDISEKERLKVDPDVMDTLVSVSKGDMRMGITLLQTSSQFNAGHVTKESVLETAALPPVAFMDEIWRVATQRRAKPIMECAEKLQAEGFSLSSVLCLFQERLLNCEDIDDVKKARILVEIAGVDKAIEDGASEDLQFRKLLSKCIQENLIKR